MEAEMSAFVASLERNITDEDVVNLEACIDCKHCGDACAWYLASDDETLHPTYKTNFVRQIYKRFLTLEGKVAGSLGLTATPTVEDLRDHMSSFWSCTACGRCTLACPAGLSTRRIVRLARAAYSDSELSLENPTLRAPVELLTRDGKLFDQLFNAHACFKVFKQNLHRGASSAQHPCAADFAGDAFDSRALRPIKSLHVPFLASIVNLLLFAGKQWCLCNAGRLRRGLRGGSFQDKSSRF